VPVINGFIMRHGLSPSVSRFSRRVIVMLIQKLSWCHRLWAEVL
jgi:hypothetical protein